MYYICLLSQEGYEYVSFLSYSGSDPLSDGSLKLGSNLGTRQVRLGLDCSSVLFKREGPGIVTQTALHPFRLERTTGPGRNSSIVSNFFFFFFFKHYGFGKTPGILYQVLFSLTF